MRLSGCHFLVVRRSTCCLFGRTPSTAKQRFTWRDSFGRPKSSCGWSDQVQKRQDRPEPGRQGLASQLPSTATSKRGRRAWAVLSGADPARKGQGGSGGTGPSKEGRRTRRLVQRHHLVEASGILLSEHSDSPKVNIGILRT